MTQRLIKDGYILYRPDNDPGAKGCKSETAEQIDFVAWVRCWHPGHADLMFHVPNEGDRSPQYRQQLHKMGELKGCADLIFFGLNGAAFEMKKANWGARLSPEQKKFLRLSSDAGRFACVCHGAEAAKVAFLEWVGGK